MKTKDFGGGGSKENWERENGKRWQSEFNELVNRRPNPVRCCSRKQYRQILPALYSSYITKRPYIYVAGS